MHEAGAARRIIGEACRVAEHHGVRLSTLHVEVGSVCDVETIRVHLEAAAATTVAEAAEVSIHQTEQLEPQAIRLVSIEGDDQPCV